MRKRVIIAGLIAVGLIASVATFAGSNRTVIRAGGPAVHFWATGDDPRGHRAHVTCRSDVKNKKRPAKRGNYYFMSAGQKIKIRVGAFKETVKCVKPKRNAKPPRTRDKGKVKTQLAEPRDENSQTERFDGLKGPGTSTSKGSVTGGGEI